MARLREILKRRSPKFLRHALVAMRAVTEAPPLENIVLHDYELSPDAERRPRLSLVIPNVSPRSAFGGVTTGIEILLEIGQRTGADLRIILDDLDAPADRSLIDGRARRLGLAPDRIEITRRTSRTPVIETRRSDVFLCHNWWTALNIRSLLEKQSRHFAQEHLPHLYLVQEYEPQFYPFSSTHMLARFALESPTPCIHIFNSSQLFEYFRQQGHSADSAFVFEPQLSSSLRPFLLGDKPEKTRRLLVYGRPSVVRNCFPALEKGLKLWVERYPQYSDWEIVSAGMPHDPLKLGRGRVLQSLGKLSLEAYGELLRTTAVGLSLMASPHPSYPPLEMAHFGVITITNRYANKDLSRAHGNIVSLDNISAEAIAEALTGACERFLSSPQSGWTAESRMPSFLSSGPLACLDDLATELVARAWPERSGQRGRPASSQAGVATS